MPQSADRAYKAIAGRARLEVVRYLMAHPGASTPDIIAGAGVGKPTVWSALRELDELGYLDSSHPEGERQGRAVTFTIRANNLDSDLRDLLRYAEGL